MKELIVGKDAAIKLRKEIEILYQSDFSKGVSGLYPGEFVILKDEVKNLLYIAHCYSLDKKYPILKIHGMVQEKVDAKTTIINSLVRAIEYRKLFKNYKENMRLVFGKADGLPGLIIDSYTNLICLRLATCAYDPFLPEIETVLKDEFPGLSLYVESRAQDRLEIGQPVLDYQSNLSDIMAYENGIDFLIKPEIFQKNGFYFDHRENRIRAINILKNLNIDMNRGLDLFSYLGAWGIGLLKEELCKEMVFVDQADLMDSFDYNLAHNNLSDRGSFCRDDVFDFLSKEIKKEVKYDLICCDPPAFAKSKSAKKSALVGYKKLHTLNLKLLKPGGIYIAASCTHYVTMDEFQSGIYESSQNVGRKIKMLDIGLQSGDHSFSHFASKQNYIKYFLYFVE